MIPKSTKDILILSNFEPIKYATAHPSYQIGMVTATHSASELSEHRYKMVSAMSDSSAATKLEAQFLRDLHRSDRDMARLSAQSLLSEVVQLRLLSSEQYLAADTSRSRHMKYNWILH